MPDPVHCREIARRFNERRFIIMPVAHHMGFEIAENKFRLVELRSQAGELSILHADEYETEYNFGSHLLHDAPYNEVLAKSFLRDLTQFFRRQQIFSSSVSIALTSHVPFISTLPIDVRLRDEEVQEHLQWEYALLSDISRREDITFFPFLLRENCDANTYLCISVPRQTVEFLKTSFSLFTLNTKVLTVDHFAVEHAVQRFGGQNACALIGLHRQYYTLSLIDKEKYIGFKTGKLSSTEYHLAPILRSLQELMHLNENQRCDIVYMYGSACDDAIVSSLEALLNIRVRTFSPLANIAFAQQTHAQRAMVFAPSTFCAALGSAMQQE